MIRDDKDLIVEIFRTIEAEWAFCDENDEDGFYVLVNEDRDEHPTIKPLKSLVKELETDGYIRFDEERSDPKGKEREYMEFLDETIPVRFVYFYRISNKGKQLYEKFSTY